MSCSQATCIECLHTVPNKNGCSGPCCHNVKKSQPTTKSNTKFACSRHTCAYLSEEATSRFSNNPAWTKARNGPKYLGEEARRRDFLIFGQTFFFILNPQSPLRAFIESEGNRILPLSVKPVKAYQDLYVQLSRSACLDSKK
jgi:hypothetical protein